MPQMLPRHWIDIRRDWSRLAMYERFETVVAYVLTIVMSAVVLIALGRLIVSIVDTLILRSLNPLDHKVFQAVFGELMTLLIALEFNHTLRYTLTGERGIIHTNIVILIALLALARKVIAVDLYEATPASVLSVAALALALGITYWLVNERRPDPSAPQPPSPDA
jgi:uncharacterized membrane protein (DUF373 family)